jgi:Domain of unknown function (DUF4185)
MRHPKLVVGVLALVLASLGSGGMAQGHQPQISAPYPQSGTITSVSWDFAHVTQIAFGSDIWPVTWASDDNLYTGWGDGIGFGTFDFNEQWSSPKRASMGFSRISGGPTNFTAINVWGGENRLNAPTVCGKTRSMISVDGVLYCSVASYFNNTSNNEFQCASNPSTPELRLAWSSDLSESWTQSTWKVVQNPGTFSFANFLNFGKDNAGAFDSNVYLYGPKAGDMHNTYLARVPKTDLKDNPAQSTAYQYFAGLDGSGSPIWASSDTQSKPVFTDPNGSSSFSVVYDAPLRRYLATEIHGPDFDTAGNEYPTKNFGLFEAPTPWGPWSTIAYYTDWGGYSAANPGEGGHIPTKWIGSDGKTIWVIFSWPDAFNMVQGTLTVGASSAGPEITDPVAGSVFAPGQTVTATGTGTNLIWDADRISDGQPSFAQEAGFSFTFTVPADSTSAQHIHLTLTDDGGSVSQDYAIGSSTGFGK